MILHKSKHRQVPVLIGLIMLTVSACDSGKILSWASQTGIQITPQQAELVATHVTNPLHGSKLNWAALRKCESGGNYRSVNRSGKYRGAYQFDQNTWNANAPSGWSGVRPDAAPPSVQDRAAWTLFSRRGRSPWPVCGRRL